MMMNNMLRHNNINITDLPTTVNRTGRRPRVTVRRVLMAMSADVGCGVACRMRDGRDGQRDERQQKFLIEL